MVFFRIKNLFHSTTPSYKHGYVNFNIYQSVLLHSDLSRLLIWGWSGTDNTGQFTGKLRNLWLQPWSVIINIHDHHRHRSLANQKWKIGCYSKPGHLVFPVRPIRCKGGVNTPYRTVIACTGTELVRTWERERQTSDDQALNTQTQVQSSPELYFSTELLNIVACRKLFTSCLFCSSLTMAWRRCTNIAESLRIIKMKTVKYLFIRLCIIITF